MELLYLNYQIANKPPRYILLLYLGERNGKFCGLTTDGVTDSERNRLRAHASTLSSLSLEERLQWCRDHIPHRFHDNYREISKNKAKILSRHPIN